LGYFNNNNTNIINTITNNPQVNQTTTQTENKIDENIKNKV